MICNACLEVNVPDCTDNIVINGLFESLTDYVVTVENHFDKRLIQLVTSNYGGAITLADVPQGWFFRGNTYTVKVYADYDAFECDDPLTICAYKTCIALTFYEADTDEDTFNINCCE